MKPVNNMTNETITPTPDITANVTDKNNCDIQCPDGYEFYDANGNLIGNKVMMRPKKPKYPNDYKTCCDVLYANSNHNECYEACLRGYPVETFARLLICRDAHWKIAGEEMGLGKDWEPDWNDSTPKYTIVVIGNDLVKHYTFAQNFILAFPTVETRDIFYENFKDLIEQCKSLL